MTDVVMPQMGESIAEGTIVRWIKKVGDRVDLDEPLFEISTDKVDAEIPSPIAGVLLGILAKEGETVAVHAVVAIIGDAEAPAPQSTDDVRRQKSSPLVRKIAGEHHVDIARIPGTGLGGRVTKHDILGFIAATPALASSSSSAPATPAIPAPPSSRAQPSHHVPAFRPGEDVDVVPMSVMRKKIAEHMVFSRRTSAHVHSVFEVDYSRIAKIREAKKAEYEKAGARLTFMSFILKATVDALKALPILNASIDGDTIVYKKDINIGVAVALEWGLIVPVIKRADEKNVVGLSRALVDLAGRARSRQLKPDEVQGGTFTITNPGGFGALFGLPIISQPQVAIMGVGTIEKRVAVVDDAIAIRLKGYLTLGYDHRLVDGAVADEFMSQVKKTLENFDPTGV